MPKAKSKSASGDDSGPPTRQNSTDPVADESTGVSDDTSQVTNDTSASLPVARTSSLGYGTQQASTFIHTVVNRPVYDGKIEHFPSWEMQLEAHLHEKKMSKLLTEDNPDPAENENL